MERIGDMASGILEMSSEPLHRPALAGDHSGWERSLSRHIRRELTRLLESPHRFQDETEASRWILYSSLGLLGAWDGALFLRRKDEAHAQCSASTSPNCALHLSLSQTIQRRNIRVVRLDDTGKANGIAVQKPDDENHLSRFAGGYLVYLRSRSTLEGVLLLGRSRTRPEWADWESLWLRRMAALAGQTLKLARLEQERHQLRQELDRKVLQLLTLFESGKEIHSFSKWEMLTKNVLYTAMGNLGVRDGYLLTPQEVSGAFRMAQVRQASPRNDLEDICISAKDFLLGKLMELRRAIRRHEIETLFPEHPILQQDFDVLIPGVSSRGIEFIMLLGNRLTPDAFTPDEMEYLSILGAQAAVVFENRDLVHQNIRAERLAAIGQALAALSHDFRGVLNGLSGASRHLGKLVSRMADGQEVDAHRLEKWWEVIRANEKRLANLVENIVEYSKPRTPLREPCQINQMILELAAQREEECRKRKVELRLELDPTLPDVLVDSTRIYRALFNLLNNAFEAVESGKGRIVIRTIWKEPFIEIHLEDNGEGIAPENLEVLFDPLFTTRKGSTGTGFGLANVKKIIEEHEGVVAVRSELNQGSRFCLKIPCTQALSLEAETE